MIAKWPRLVINTIAGQLIALLFLAVIGLQATLAAHFFWQTTQKGASFSPPEKTGWTAALVNTYAAASAEERGAVLSAIRKVEPGFRLASPSENGRFAGAPPAADPLTDLLAEGLTLHPAASQDAGAGGPQTAPDPASPLSRDRVVTLKDGTALFVPGQTAPLATGPLFPTTIILLFLGLASFMIAGWAIIIVTAPLRRFVRVVERIRDLQAIEELPEDGPHEIRTAFAAFNRMSKRIAKLVAEKTHMLAAVSHDLRTPITRLKLRAEFIEDEAIRKAILADLDHMATLTQGALQLLTGTESREAFRPTDLPSLLQTIADQFSDFGHDVSYVGPERFRGLVRISDLQRAVTNLVDNALRHGTKVTVELHPCAEGEVDIRVCDNGPGIAEGERARLVEPFERGDEARTPGTTAGFGLGLTIARDIAEAHGGALHLSDAEPHGLMATLHFKV